MKKNLWWGYLHINNSIQIKPWFGEQFVLDDAYESPFVAQVVEPFEADTREEAVMIIERELDGYITGA